MNTPRIFRYFKTSSEIIRLAVMMDFRSPLSLRRVEDLPLRAGDRHHARNGSVLVDPVRDDFCG